MKTGFVLAVAGDGGIVAVETRRSNTGWLSSLVLGVGGVAVGTLVGIALLH